MWNITFWAVLQTAHSMETWIIKNEINTCVVCLEKEKKTILRDKYAFRTQIWELFVTKLLQFQFSRQRPLNNELFAKTINFSFTRLTWKFTDIDTKKYLEVCFERKPLPMLAEKHFLCLLHVSRSILSRHLWWPSTLLPALTCTPLLPLAVCQEVLHCSQARTCVCPVGKVFLADQYSSDSEIYEKT